jgi:hypothetical protein
MNPNKNNAAAIEVATKLSTPTITAAIALRGASISETYHAATDLTALLSVAQNPDSEEL